MLLIGEQKVAAGGQISAIATINGLQTLGILLSMVVIGPLFVRFSGLRSLFIFGSALCAGTVAAAACVRLRSPGDD